MLAEDDLFLGTAYMAAELTLSDFSTVLDWALGMYAPCTRPPANVAIAVVSCR